MKYRQQFGHLLRGVLRDVGATAEFALCAADDDDSGLVVGSDGLEDVSQLTAHRVIENIERWRLQADLRNHQASPGLILECDRQWRTSWLFALELRWALFSIGGNSLTGVFAVEEPLLEFSLQRQSLVDSHL